MKIIVFCFSWIKIESPNWKSKTLSKGTVINVQVSKKGLYLNTSKKDNFYVLSFPTCSSDSSGHKIDSQVRVHTKGSQKQSGLLEISFQPRHSACYQLAYQEPGTKTPSWQSQRVELTVYDRKSKCYTGELWNSLVQLWKLSRTHALFIFLNDISMFLIFD